MHLSGTIRRAVTTCGLVVAGLGLGAPAAHAQPTVVDLELSLLVDVSGSVTAAEFALQRGGYVNAFNNPLVYQAIAAGTTGRIVANLIYWSSATQQQLAVNWTLIDSFAAAQSFATAVGAAGRPFSGGTSPGPAISFATPLFFSNTFAGSRLVIDVSGDGCGSAAQDRAARDAALAAGITTINGVVIGGSAAVRRCYQDNIVGGVGAFVEEAATFEDFDAAIQRKLLREIAPPSVVPEPATYVLVATGLAAMVAVRRRGRAT